MHTFIYPSQDTYINNSPEFIDKNFGIDEILEIYASNKGTTTVYTDPNWHPAPVTASSYGNNGWLAYTTSSLFIYSGSKWYSYNLTSSVIPFTSFIANFTGRLSNVTTVPRKSLYISGSATLAAGRFVGSITGSNCVSRSFSGSFSSSSFKSIINTNTSSVSYFVNVTNFTGYFKGQYSGSFTRPSTATYLNYPEFSRTLLKFDISELSQSISSNNISGSNIKFTLNLKSCGARNLPLNYKIYAYPISKSWDMGVGRYDTDGIGSFGASWYYNTTQNTSSLWYSPTSSTETYDFSDYLLTSSLGSASFQNGGATWLYNVPSTYLQPTSSTSSSFYNISSGSKYISSFCSSSLSGSSLICSQSYFITLNVFEY